MKYDYWIHGGKVVDPKREVEKVDDILISNGKIMPSVSGSVEAEDVIDATGCFVLPGLTDFHTHIAYPASDSGYPADVILLPNGVTAAVDGGSLGWASFPVFYRHIIASQDIAIKSLLNIVSDGMPVEPYFENTDPEYYNEQKLRYTFENYGDKLLGLKVRIGRNVNQKLGIRPLVATVEMGEKLGVPVVAHVVHPEQPYTEILKFLRTGDILCHCFQGQGPYSILNSDGTVQEAVLEARTRGVIFDYAAGRKNYTFEVAQKAIKAGFYPDIISSDLFAYSVYRKTAFALPYILSAFIAMGMPLLEIIRRCTQIPARLMKLSNSGTLAPGSVADVAIFKFEERKMQFKDQFGNAIPGKGLLVPQMTIKAGRIVYRQVTFMDW
jgi:dihydroorotase